MNTILRLKDNYFLHAEEKLWLLKNGFERKFKGLFCRLLSTRMPFSHCSFSLVLFLSLLMTCA